MRAPTVRWAASFLAMAAAIFVSASAGAQEYLIGASASASSGVEGGAQQIMRRTRTRLRLGTDLRVDESPDDILELGLLAEIEPQGGLGADVRYAHMVGTRFVLDAGALGILAPASLYGACAGLTYRLALSKRTQVTLGPEIDAYFLGTDLPDGSVLWQARFQGGLRVDL